MEFQLYSNTYSYSISPYVQQLRILLHFQVILLLIFIHRLCYSLNLGHKQISESHGYALVKFKCTSNCSNEL